MKLRKSKWMWITEGQSQVLLKSNPVSSWHPTSPGHYILQSFRHWRSYHVVEAWVSPCPLWSLLTLTVHTILVTYLGIVFRALSRIKVVRVLKGSKEAWDSRVQIAWMYSQSLTTKEQTETTIKTDQRTKKKKKWCHLTLGKLPTSQIVLSLLAQNNSWNLKG